MTRKYRFAEMNGGWFLVLSKLEHSESEINNIIADMFIRMRTAIEKNMPDDWKEGMINGLLPTEYLKPIKEAVDNHHTVYFNNVGAWSRRNFKTKIKSEKFNFIEEVWK